MFKQPTSRPIEARLNLKEDTVNKTKSFIVMFCLVVLFAVAAPGAMMADSFDEATKLTFSAPVEVPGHVLTPGTYWFTLADISGSRNIVEIWNADRTQLVTMLPTISDSRAHAASDTIITFEERPSGQPEAIHSWFYPGSDTGEEFVYNK
jgi:hypothetical protein